MDMFSDHGTRLARDCLNNIDLMIAAERDAIMNDKLNQARELVASYVLRGELSKVA